MEKKIIIDQTPVPQGRPRVTRWATYDPNHDQKIWVKFQLREQFKEKLECPIELDIKYYLPIPKSTSKKKQAQMLSGEIKHVKRPDGDNILKNTLDCMNDVIIKDDSQIYKFTVEKLYDSHPRSEIIIKW